MKILLLAPQPFFVERGTPIAVRLAAEALARDGHEVDLLTYHDGEAVVMPGVRHHRIARPPGVRAVPIGFSFGKLLCDAYMVGAAIRLVRRFRHDVVHAVEEAVFIGMALRLIRRMKLIYDADSILSEQIGEKWPRAGPVIGLLGAVEAMAMRKSDLVLAVCPAVASRASDAGARDVHLLPDVAMPPVPPDGPVEDLRRLAGGRRLALYVGNLEGYQGVDLLLEAMCLVPRHDRPRLIAIGGNDRSLPRYRERVAALGLDDDVLLLGPRPFAMLQHYLAQADFLCSPRLTGRNTPMKIYSYMGSGRAVLATDIESHHQVLDRTTALLVPPTAAAMAAGLSLLSHDRRLRERLGETAAALAQSEYGPAAFEGRLRRAYSALATTAPRQAGPVSAV